MDIWPWVAEDGNFDVALQVGVLLDMSPDTHEHRQDGRHKTDSSFHVAPKVPRIFAISTELMESIHTRIYEAKLEASQKHVGDQIKEKMASPWKHCSLSPK